MFSLQIISLLPQIAQIQLARKGVNRFSIKLLHAPIAPEIGASKCDSALRSDASACANRTMATAATPHCEMFWKHSSSKSNASRHRLRAYHNVVVVAVVVVGGVGSDHYLPLPTAHPA